MGETKKTRILILGAGFAGIYTAINLSKRYKKNEEIEITIVDGNRYHLFKPMLHEVATGSVDPTHIIQPIRSIMKGRNFSYYEGLVQDIDLKNKKVSVCSECAYCEKVNEMNVDDFDIARSCLKPLKKKIFEYDYLVLALGGMPNFYNIPGVAENAFPLYSLDDAVKIRQHIVRAFEISDHIEDHALRERLLTFIVAGAGPTGIEFITELHDWIFDSLVEGYENIKDEHPRLILVEAGHDVLPFSADNIRRDAGRTLDEMKIEIMTDSPVAKLEKNRVHIGGKNPRTIESSTLIWAAGVKGSAIIERLDAGKDRIGRIIVDETLQVTDYPGVYALGDCAHFQAKGHDFPLPQTGQVAVQQAVCLVENIVRDISGKPKKPFIYRDLGSMVSLGERTAVSNLLGYIGLSGFAGWLTWKLVYLKHLMGIQRKLRVGLEWFFDITYDREASRHKFG